MPMEKYGKAHLLLAVVFCGALCAFTYTMGRQAGERDTRDLMERSMLERRMAAVIDRDHDLYMGDEEFEDDSDLYAESAPAVQELAGEAHSIPQATDTGDTGPLR
jgi:hypothetical protein